MKPNYQKVTYHTFAWFIGEEYGMNLEFNATVDVNADIESQLFRDMNWQESHSKYLKNRTIAGHIKHGVAFYVDNGRVVEV